MVREEVVEVNNRNRDWILVADKAALARPNFCNA